MNTTASETKSMPGCWGIKRNIAIAQNPRSTTPIRTCSSVRRADGNTTFQPFWPSSRRSFPVMSQTKYVAMPARQPSAISLFMAGGSRSIAEAAHGW